MNVLRFLAVSFVLMGMSVVVSTAQAQSYSSCVGVPSSYQPCAIEHGNFQSESLNAFISVAAERAALHETYSNDPISAGGGGIIKPLACEPCYTNLNNCLISCGENNRQCNYYCYLANAYCEYYVCH